MYLTARASTTCFVNSSAGFNLRLNSCNNSEVILNNTVVLVTRLSDIFGRQVGLYSVQ